MNRAHVDRDIEPYVCISEECKEPIQFFVHSREWKDHMQQFHTLDWTQRIYTTVWYCDMDHSDLPKQRIEDDFTYQEKEELVEHLSSAHENALTRVQILARTRRSKTQKQRGPFICPLCDFCPAEVSEKMSEKPYDLLSSHIGRHLKALAFHSLNYIETSGSIAESSDCEGDHVNHEGNYLHGSTRVLDTRSTTEALVDEHDFPETVIDDPNRQAGSSPEVFEEVPELENPITWSNTLMKTFPENDNILNQFASLQPSNIMGPQEHLQSDEQPIINLEAASSQMDLEQDVVAQQSQTSFEPPTRDEEDRQWKWDESRSSYYYFHAEHACYIDQTGDCLNEKGEA